MTTIPVQQTIEDLRGTLNALREHGWAQGQFQRSGGCLCLLGALRYAISGRVGPPTPEERPRGEAAQKQLGEQVDIIGDFDADRSIWDGLDEWNDVPGRTKEEVIGLVVDTITRLNSTVDKA